MSDWSPYRFVVAFTGTRAGMTTAQQVSVGRMLDMLGEKHGKRVRGVHGDCVGADAAFDALCAQRGFDRWTFPSNIERYRAHCEKRGAIERGLPADPLRRNVKIVAAARLLIVASKSDAEELRSGTWATVRWARKFYRMKGQGKVVVVWPSGFAEYDYPVKVAAKLGT